MFNRNPDKAEQAWKAKYFSSLEELEQKEKTWESLDNIMRTAMSRLSIMLVGLDRELDKELDYLRRALRKGSDGSKIRKIITSTLGVLEKVEQRQKKFKRLTASEAYQHLLEKMVLPKGTAREVKSLTRSIKHLGDDENPSEVIDEFVVLLKHSFTLIKDSTEERLSENGSAPPEKEIAPRAVDLDMNSEPDLSGRAVLESLLDEILLPDTYQTDVKKVKQRLQDVKVGQELDRLAHQVANILNEALPVAQQHESVANLITDDDLTINEILLQLLERIELPSEMSEEVGVIQNQLEGSVSENEWPDLLERISRLIRTMREQAQKEKKNLETFLTQLTDQLQTLDNFISGVEQDHQHSILKSQEFTGRMDDHIQHMGRSIDEASDLDQLKIVVRERLETLEKHMGEFRNHEEQRDETSQEKITELNIQIKDMEKDSEELRKNVMKEREMALMDPLTEIKNRLAYDERIDQDYMRWKRYHSSLSLMVIDIDLFKKINDNYGHIAGDKVLHTVAQHLQNNIRETDFLARYGGEEFVIVMPDTTVAEGLNVAEKLRQEVEGCGFHYRGDDVCVTISCGVAEFSDEDTPDIAFEKADVAMYKAKESGRNRCMAA
ncbi:MAG: diguanylate cyclase [Gammaproteobacteria bacterium]|nr:diguanylate cyclase [Gammaproteobacteria bacterium]